MRTGDRLWRSVASGQGVVASAAMLASASG